MNEQFRVKNEAVLEFVHQCISMLKLLPSKKAYNNFFNSNITAGPLALDKLVEVINYKFITSTFSMFDEIPLSLPTDFSIALNSSCSDFTSVSSSEHNIIEQGDDLLFFMEDGTNGLFLSEKPYLFRSFSFYICSIWNDMKLSDGFKNEPSCINKELFDGFFDSDDSIYKIASPLFENMKFALDYAEDTSYFLVFKSDIIIAFKKWSETFQTDSELTLFYIQEGKNLTESILDTHISMSGDISSNYKTDKYLYKGLPEDTTDVAISLQNQLVTIIKNRIYQHNYISIFQSDTFSDSIMNCFSKKRCTWLSKGISSECNPDSWNYQLGFTWDIYPFYYVAFSCGSCLKRLQDLTDTDIEESFQLLEELYQYEDADEDGNVSLMDQLNDTIALKNDMLFSLEHGYTDNPWLNTLANDFCKKYFYNLISEKDIMLNWDFIIDFTFGTCSDIDREVFTFGSKSIADYRKIMNVLPNTKEKILLDKSIKCISYPISCGGFLECDPIVTLSDEWFCVTVLLGDDNNEGDKCTLNQFNAFFELAFDVADTLSHYIVLNYRKHTK